jgi:hypothetical protein
MEITKEKYKEILDIQMISYNENSRWFTETLAEINQALRLPQLDVISNDKPEWLTSEVLDLVKKLWDMPNENNSNPKTSAIKLVRKKAKEFGYEIDLKKAVEIVKNIV